MSRLVVADTHDPHACFFFFFVATVRCFRVDGGGRLKLGESTEVRPGVEGDSPGYKEDGVL